MRLFERTPFDRPPHCERCGRLEAECACPPETPEGIPPSKQTARLAVERRKKGKQVTVVRGLAADEDALSELLTHLKSACGAGGTLADGMLEIQGNQAERIRAELERLGYRVKG